MEILGPEIVRVRLRRAVEALGGISSRTMEDLEKRREDRFQSMEAMSQAVQLAAAGVPGSAQAPTLSLPADALAYRPPTCRPADALPAAVAAAAHVDPAARLHAAPPRRSAQPGATVCRGQRARRRRGGRRALLCAGRGTATVSAAQRRRQQRPTRLGAGPPHAAARPPPVVPAAPDAGVPDARVKAPTRRAVEDGDGTLVVIVEAVGRGRIDGSSAG
jgi:hypothetical protein